MKSAVRRALYRIRDLRAGRLYSMLARSCSGDVLDVGGWDFYETATARKVPFASWTVLEPDRARLTPPKHPRVRMVCGDGRVMPFGAGRFDSVLCIQVLEHVLEPLAVVREMARVLKPGGAAVLLLPQTSTLHMVPNHYYNFTRYWVLEGVAGAGMEVEELVPLGGFWSSTASRAALFFLQSFRYRFMSPRECKRPLLHYPLLPFMWAFAALTVAVSLVFSAGDLSEEPNNHLVLARKPGGRPPMPAGAGRPG